MKILKFLFGLLCLLILIFVLGPKPDYPEIDARIPEINSSLSALPSLLKKNDSEVHSLRPGNESKLVWADSVRQTDFALLYLHGFSASPMEGEPMIANMAKRYGMNYYAPLLAGHGSASQESFLDITPQDWIADAAEALAIARQIGKKVIAMSCSTGSTLAIYLAAQDQEAIAAHVMYSPNLDLEDASSQVMSYPWGLQIAKTVMGSDYRSFSLSEEAMPFWTTTYRLEGLQALRFLLNETMQPAIWHEFNDPYLIAYYYASASEKDNIISVDAIEEFHELNNAEHSTNTLAPLAEPQSHVIASPLQSKNTAVVEQATMEFLDKIISQNQSPVSY